MRVTARRFQIAFAGFALAVLAAVTCASATGGQWVKLTDKPEGFALTVPNSMFFVPNSVAKVKAIITKLKQQNEAGTAAVYSQIIGSSDVTKFVYEGFFYSPSATVQPLFTLGVFRTPAANTTPTGLAAVANSAASTLRAKGATIVSAKVVKLPAGGAARIQAEEGSGAAKSFLEIYMVGDGTRVYELTFRTGASRASLATFESIAKRFAFA